MTQVVFKPEEVFAKEFSPSCYMVLLLLGIQTHYWTHHQERRRYQNKQGIVLPRTDTITKVIQEKYT